MNKGSVIETLRRHEPELKAAGIVHLRLFGSVARGEESAQSDVDLMADLDRSKRLSLVGMAHLENRLSDLLGVKVDLSPVESMKESVRTRAAREAIHAFWGCKIPPPGHSGEHRAHRAICQRNGP